MPPRIQSFPLVYGMMTVLEGELRWELSEKTLSEKVKGKRGRMRGP